MSRERESERESAHRHRAACVGRAVTPPPPLQLAAVCVVAIAGFKPWYAAGPTGNPFRSAMNLAGTSWKMGDLSQSRREEVSGLMEAAAKLGVADGGKGATQALAFKGDFDKWVKSRDARKAYQSDLGVDSSKSSESNEPQQLASDDQSVKIIDAVDSSPEITALKEQVAKKKAALAADKAKLASLEAEQEKRTKLAQQKEDAKLHAPAKVVKKISLKGMSPGVRMPHVTSTGKGRSEATIPPLLTSFSPSHPQKIFRKAHEKTRMMNTGDGRVR